MKKTAIILLGVAAFVLLLWNMTTGPKIRVEVCMEYQGRQACRTASSDTKEGAQRTATENACALIASGMTDTMTCQRQIPLKVEWK